MAKTLWMIVEDNLELQTVLSAMCEMWDVQPIVFSDGNAAIAWLDVIATGAYQGPLPDVALLDVRLPGESGPNIGARLRAIPSLGRTAVILMSAYWMSSSNKQETLALCQADLMLDKPLPDMDILRQMIEESVAKRHATVPPEDETPSA